MVGSCVGIEVGDIEEVVVGRCVGIEVGDIVGVVVGRCVGIEVGDIVGLWVGTMVGGCVGAEDIEGWPEATLEGASEGRADGSAEGQLEGRTLKLLEPPETVNVQSDKEPRLSISAVGIGSVSALSNNHNLWSAERFPISVGMGPVNASGGEKEISALNVVAEMPLNVVRNPISVGSFPERL
jgi:hypothetical protein